MYSIKKLGILTGLLTLIFSSCVSTPKEPPIDAVITEPVTVDTEPIIEAVEPVGVEPETSETAIVEVFDPKTVTKEVREATLFDIKGFIESLNSIIQNQDYEKWNSYLTDSYRSYYSSEKTLAELSEIFVIKRQGIVLRSLRDYFQYVVYPSRQNDKVDEIEFIGQNLVRAFTYNTKGDRLVLYTLQKVGDIWKITRQ